jgi:hypothetical protein
MESALQRNSRFGLFLPVVSGDTFSSQRSIGLPGSENNYLLVRFEAFTAVTMTNVVFWHVRCVELRLTDVSEGRIASIFRVE